MSRRHAVRNVAIDCRDAGGLGTGGPPEFRDRRRQRCHAHQTAARTAGFVVIAGGVIRRRLSRVQRRCGDVMNVRRVVGMCVNVPFGMGGNSMFVDVDRPPTVFAFGEAGRGARPVVES